MKFRSSYQMDRKLYRETLANWPKRAWTQTLNLLKSGDTAEEEKYWGRILDLRRIARSTYQFIKHSFDIAEAFLSIFQRLKSIENFQTIDTYWCGSQLQRITLSNRVSVFALATKGAKDNFSFCRLFVDISRNFKNASVTRGCRQPFR